MLRSFIEMWTAYETSASKSLYAYCRSEKINYATMRRNAILAGMHKNKCRTENTLDSENQRKEKLRQYYRVYRVHHKEQVQAHNEKYNHTRSAIVRHYRQLLKEKGIDLIQPQNQTLPVDNNDRV